MEIRTDISLKNHTTMKLGGPARFMAEAHTPEDVQQAFTNAKKQGLALYVLGGGSNTIVHDEGFDGLVLKNRIPGFTIVADTPSQTTIQVGAGENWDETVQKTVEMHLSGLEALSAIPGTIGAAPVQNIGAYGAEVGNVIDYVDAYDSQTDQFVRLTADDCAFRYRDSIFRHEQKGRYCITAITMTLGKHAPAEPFYDAVQQYFDARGISFYTVEAVRQAVMAIRADKLPDPKLRPNAGSFFKNAIVEDWQYNDLKKQYPDIPSYEMPDDHFKIPTGWLIDQVGLRGQLIHGMRVHDKNALVLINESATSYRDLAEAREAIHGAVRDKFRISIEQEPLELGS